MTLYRFNRLGCTDPVLLCILLSLGQPVMGEMCEAVVPLAIVVVILSFTSFGLFMVLVWTYIKFQRRSSSYNKSISRASTRSRPPPRVAETEAYFTNKAMSTSTGSMTGAAALSSRQPAPRGISPAPSHSTYGHQTGRVHDPPKYHPGTSRPTSGSQYGRY
ncbi:hypothetical protein CAPTEDRAFT_224538 [Capitella teleta]|uniref:Down syndrome cell adhesion molecule C-terminal domain-containing protein n=1 Tax=Capitella teleta TaxID=283909 RepID=R7TTD1_CAPTE|nr:hypothetical protein CAPTEDRAFT_224538 [Capitella teleta]|eukprot:ELT96914.1 hypothetical protein CAPTEDRAFT_224538 [Capitella teleta]